MIDPNVLPWIVLGILTGGLCWLAGLLTLPVILVFSIVMEKRRQAKELGKIAEGLASVGERFRAATKGAGRGGPR